MSAAYDYAFPRVVGVEGSTLDRTPSDRGNWTSGVVGQGVLRGSRFGISAMAYPTLDIAGLTLEAAKILYQHDYWDKIAGDELPGEVAVLVFDCAVNQGVATAVKLLQQSVGAVDDGVLGPRTVEAVKRRGNDTTSLRIEYAARRMFRYATTGTFPTFGLGWARRLFTMNQAAADFSK